ncbi:hypothetical protein B0H14DRAFT_3438862 [Mycena olivaceomarginata]|nr:hypothetical protein B0H14DRAFT_3438862 [Mycena olivaceomarginata]
MSLHYVNLKIHSRLDKLLPLTFLEPLYSCPMLETVILDGDMTLQDADITCIGASWPNLRSLCLQDNSNRLNPGVHLHMLVALTAWCPGLHTIEMSVDVCPQLIWDSYVPLPSGVECLALLNSLVHVEDVSMGEVAGGYVSVMPGQQF